MSAVVRGTSVAVQRVSSLAILPELPERSRLREMLVGPTGMRLLQALDERPGGEAVITDLARELGMNSKGLRNCSYHLARVGYVEHIQVATKTGTVVRLTSKDWSHELPLPDRRPDGGPFRHEHGAPGLKDAERRFLTALQDLGGRATPGDAARRAGIVRKNRTGSTLRSTTPPDYLAERGYVTVDGRALGLVSRITERGRARLVEMRTIPVVEIPSGLTTRRGQELAGEKWRVDVPVQFRSAAEVWLRHALETGGNDLGVWAHVKSFLRWYDSAHPGTPNLVDLQPQDLTTFAEALYAIPTRTHTGHRSTHSIQMAAQGTRRFLAFLQATGSDLLDPALSLDAFKARTPLRNGRFILAEAPSSVRSVAEVEQRAQTEMACDVWNLERIPGVKIKDHHTKFTLTFNRIPPAFRSLVKEYVGFNLLVAGTVPSTEAMRISSLARFFTRFAEKHPTADDLRQLTAADLADFLAYLRATPGKRGGGSRPAYLNDHLGDVEGLIRHLQRHEHALAPFKVADQIFLPEFRQREPRQASGVAKYIPKIVLEQLDQHLLDLPPHVRPIVVVLRASGWRISDVLMLQYDHCLRREGNQWWLVGDIQKTEIFGHEIPLDAEVAAIIEAHAAGIREQFDERRNPKRYLFPSAFSIRAGKPWSSTTVSDALNKLAKDHHMVGEDGHIFRFKTHAFRHTKAVELINDYRMPLEFVRDWLGHASETMTRVYAKILSETMRKVFAEAAAQGALRIDAHGRPQRIDLDGAETFQDLGLTVLELASIRAHLDARRVEIAYCFKPAKFERKYAEIPCWTCPAAVITPDFLPQIQRQRQDVLLQIEIGTQTGRTHWVEANQRKLALIEPVIDVLTEGKVQGEIGAKLDPDAYQRRRTTVDTASEGTA